MFALFLRHSLRYWARHRALTALNIAGIALGITVFISVQVVNHTALAAFRASVDLVAGRADFEVSGDGLPFSETAYATIRTHPDITAATPLIEETAFLADVPGEYLQILGVDLFSNAPFRVYTLAKNGPSAAPSRFLTDPHSIAITEELATRLHLKIGDSIRLRTPQGIRAFQIGSLIAFDRDAAVSGADAQLALLDIASAQMNFGLAGKLTRISCRVAPGKDPKAVMEALRHLTPPGLLFERPQRRGQQVENMIGAFQLNLTALSLVSLLVGMFLVYNTVSASVVRRRAEIGLLRALGLSPQGVQTLFLGEALILGLVGIAVGLPLGLFLAQSLIGTVAQNLTSLYLLVSIREISVSPWTLALAVVLGLGAVLVAAWLPAQEAGRIPPVEALAPATLADPKRTARHQGRWLAATGIAFLFALGTAAISLHGGPAWISFGAALGVLLGFAFAVPPVSYAISRLFRPRSATGRLTFDHFGKSLHRNSTTIAALVTALAMLVGITVMVFSFRKTVETWLKQSVRADLFITPAENLQSGERQVLPPQAEAIVAALPEVAACDTYREIKITLPNPGDHAPVKLSSTCFPISGPRSHVPFRHGNGAALFAAAVGRDEAFITEPLAQKFHLNENDTLRLSSPTGPVALHIAGIFADYTTESGVILIDRETYRRHWRDESLNSLAVYLQPGVTPEAAQAKLRPLLAPLSNGDLAVYSNKQLRHRVFDIFDQTFALTDLLEVIGLLVSGFGIFLNLLILVAERRREIGILRACGAARGQLYAILLQEAALIGILGAALGIGAGLALAVTLMWVINVAFFGWTIAWATPWPFLITLPFAVIATAIAAAIGPARQAARVPIALAVKME